MSDWGVLQFIIAGGFVVIVAYHLLRWLFNQFNPAQGLIADAHAPRELKGAQLVMSEGKLFKRGGRAVKTIAYLLMHKPIALVGMPDEVYRVGNKIFVVENKYNAGKGRHVYPNHRLQLSAYRVLLMHSPYFKECDFPETAYIRDHTGRFKRVDLIGENKVISEYHRFTQLRESALDADCDTNPKMCPKCDRQSSCSKAKL